MCSNNFLTTESPFARVRKTRQKRIQFSENPPDINHATLMDWSSQAGAAEVADTTGKQSIEHICSNRIYFYGKVILTSLLSPHICCLSLIIIVNRIVKNSFERSRCVDVDSPKFSRNLGRNEMRFKWAQYVASSGEFKVLFGFRVLRENPIWRHRCS